MKYLFLISFILCCMTTNNFAQISLKYADNQTPTYEETIAMYEQLAEKSDWATLLQYGTTDTGKPLHLLVISKDKDFSPASVRSKNKRIILINNAIHAGEPCGVDASIQLVGELLNKKDKKAEWLDNVVLCIIPMYNIGGVENRGCCSRANQNGPLEHGFRGNARNLDLNRDFIKCDSQNARTFTEIFHTWQPDIFIDTHTTNGSDHQYVMTLIATERNKLQPILADFLHETMSPQLTVSMNKAGYLTAPYVYLTGETPNEGIQTFLETPRYSSGYTTLFNTLGFITEAHMLKPYKDRVLSTYQFLVETLQFTHQHAAKIGDLRKEANKAIEEQQIFPIQWALDTSKHSEFSFKGFEAKYKTSEISGLQRLYYDQNAPYERPIPHFTTYNASINIEKPMAYIVPQAWKEVIERLQWNGVKMTQLQQDKSMEVEAYYIENYETVRQPYEGHYLHYNVEVRKERKVLSFRAGDFVVEVNQKGNRYIVETLEPQAHDSFFAWNFFDSILQQKEYFSPYLFEDMAVQVLAENPDLKSALEQRKKEDTAFAEDAYAQLQFVYERSPYFEDTYRRYPVVRVLE
ncbi:MAG: M14 family metallopeptidase [Chitinophagales bacterium]